jgi:hypothetical protein
MELHGPINDSSVKLERDMKESLVAVVTLGSKTLLDWSMEAAVVVIPGMQATVATAVITVLVQVDLKVGVGEIFLDFAIVRSKATDLPG